MVGVAGPTLIVIGTSADGHVAGAAMAIACSIA